MGDGLAFIHNAHVGILFCFDCLDRMTVNMRAKWTDNLIAADLHRSECATAGENKDSI